MQVARSVRGFAVVEMLLAAVIISIVAAVAIMAVANANEDGHGGKSCRTEAREFQVAVQSYHKRHENKAYPDDHANGSVQLTSDALQLTGDLDGPALTHLDGAQRVPSTNKRGWTYDFKTHTTNSLGCSS
jgi:competence protein ComGC